MRWNNGIGFFTDVSSGQGLSFIACAFRFPPKMEEMSSNYLYSASTVATHRLNQHLKTYSACKNKVIVLFFFVFLAYLVVNVNSWLFSALLREFIQFLHWRNDEQQAILEMQSRKRVILLLECWRVWSCTSIHWTRYDIVIAIPLIKNVALSCAVYNPIFSEWWSRHIGILYFLVCNSMEFGVP